MNSKERVLSAINFKETDRLPRGEFWLERDLLKKLNGGDLTTEQTINIYRELGIDLRVWFFDSNFAIEEYKAWQESEIFLMLGFNGIYETLNYQYGFDNIMAWIVKDREKIKSIANEVSLNLLDSLKKVLEFNPDGIIIADDIAYNRSTIISPQDLRELIFPFYEKIINLVKSYDKAIFFHSDGNLNMVFEDLVRLGFSGVHSLEKEAGMDIALLREKYKSKICLMGNLGLPLLINGSEQDIYDEVMKIRNLVGEDSGFILSSSTGILDADIPAESLYIIQKALNKRL